MVSIPSFPAFMRDSLARCRQCGVKQGRGEGNGPQKGLVQQANQMAPFPIQPIDRAKDKLSRAVEKQAFVESGRFHIRAEADSAGVLRPVREMQVLYDELVTFPASGHDDCVDASIDLMDMALATGGQIKPKRLPNTQRDPARLYQ